MVRCLIILMVSVLATADVLAPAELGVEKAVQLLQQIVTRHITTEVQATKELGSEGAALFRAVQALKSRGLTGNLSSINYTELSAKLNKLGVSGMGFIQHINGLATGSTVVSMNVLASVGSSSVPKARTMTDRVAVIDRLASDDLRKRYEFPNTATDAANQGHVAMLLESGDRGAHLCSNVRNCQLNNLRIVEEMDRLGLTSRPATRDFVVRVFTAQDEFAKYTGRLDTISANLMRALSSAPTADAIEPAGVRTCILTGSPQLN